MSSINPKDYTNYLKYSFDPKFFDGEDKFIFSMEALLDGLSSIEEESIVAESILETDVTPINLDLICLMRKINVISGFLKTSLKGTRLKID